MDAYPDLYVSKGRFYHRYFHAYGMGEVSVGVCHLDATWMFVGAHRLNGD